MAASALQINEMVAAYCDAVHATLGVEATIDTQAIAAGAEYNYEVIEATEPALTNPTPGQTSPVAIPPAPNTPDFNAWMGGTTVADRGVMMKVAGDEVAQATVLRALQNGATWRDLLSGRSFNRVDASKDAKSVQPV